MNKLLNTFVDKIDFAVVDLETTGFSCYKDQVVEVAAVRIRNSKITDKFQSLVYTDYIPYYATRVHGIDTEMVADAPLLRTVRNDFKKFTKGCVLVGHNIKSFDMPFLVNAFNISEKSFCVDTLKMSRCLFSGCKTHKLEAIANRLGIRNKKYHRALADATVTAKIFLHFLRLQKSECLCLKDIIA